MRDRVADQVGQHPHQRAVATDHPDRFLGQVHLQRDPGALGGDAVDVENVVDHFVERHPVVGGVDRAGVDLGHLEQVVDHFREPDALLLDVFGLGAHLGVAHHPVGDRLRQRPDARQRGAQVVADERNQLAARSLGGAFGVLDLLFPHRAPGLVARQHHRGRQRDDRHDQQHHGDRPDGGVGHELAGAEHSGERRQGGNQHQRHHADRDRPGPGQPDDQPTDQHHRQ